MQQTANPSKTIHRSERICIDISDSVVSVIKLDPKGVMMKAGSAKAPPLPGMPDDAYVTDLSAAIKKAAWAAKVSMGFGASCVVGVSMPDITLQRFKWPEMPTDALMSVAASEIVPYLPGSKSNFHVGSEVLGLYGGELEVLVAAMPEEHAVAVDTACRWANLKPKRIDIRENARNRLVRQWCAPIEGMVPHNYAILDAGPGAANIAFYHNSHFHSNRYFQPEFVKLGEVEDFETLMSVKAGGIGSDESAIRYESGKLTGEILSALEHFHRLVGGDKISCILLMDDENIPGIEENLRAGAGVPVLKPSQWVVPGIKRPNLRRVNQDAFLDAFAVGMPSHVAHDARMDLSVPNIAKPDENAVAKMAMLPAQAPIVSPPVAPSPVVPHPPLAAPSPTAQPVVAEPQFHHAPPPMDGMVPYIPAEEGGFTPSAGPYDAPAPHTSSPNPYDVPSPYSPSSDPYGASSPYPPSSGPYGAPSPHTPSTGPYGAPSPYLPSSDPYDTPSPYPPSLEPYGAPSPYADNYHENPGMPIPAGYVELPELPPGLEGIEDMNHPIRPAVDNPPTAYHESPFDIVPAQPEDHSGFPYAIPEDPRPHPSTKIPLIAAAALTAVILIVAILIPLNANRGIRAELQELEYNIAQYESADTLFILNSERANIDTQVSALRLEINNVNERMNTIRNFYLRLPALILIPEILESSGLQVDNITVTENPHEHQVVVTGRTNNFRGILEGVEYLRLHFSHHYLLTVGFRVGDGDGDTGIDAYGFVTYTITITVNPGWEPFWLNSQVVRSWP